MTDESLDRLRSVEVLSDYLEMEVSSHSLPSKAAEKLRRDIAAIPARCRAVFVTDDAERVRRKRKAR